MVARMKLRRLPTSKTADAKPVKPRARQRSAVEHSAGELAAKKRTRGIPKLATQAKPHLFTDDTCLLRIRLPVELTNNNGGRSQTYHRSNQFRRQIEIQLRAWDLVRTPFDLQVTVTVLRVLGARQREWDQSSGLRGNWKEIEDAMVAVGWFHNDTRKWIRKVDFDQITDDRPNGPSIIVEIRHA